MIYCSELLCADVMFWFFVFKIFIIFEIVQREITNKDLAKRLFGKIDFL